MHSTAATNEGGRVNPETYDPKLAEAARKAFNAAVSGSPSKPTAVPPPVAEGMEAVQAPARNARREHPDVAAAHARARVEHRRRRCVRTAVGDGRPRVPAPAPARRRRDRRTSHLARRLGSADPMRLPTNLTPGPVTWVQALITVAALAATLILGLEKSSPPRLWRPSPRRRSGTSTRRAQSSGRAAPASPLTGSSATTAVRSSLFHRAAACDSIHKLCRSIS